MFFSGAIYFVLGCWMFFWGIIWGKVWTQKLMKVFLAFFCWRKKNRWKASTACFSLKRKEPLSHGILFGVCKVIFVMMNRYYCIMLKSTWPFLNFFFGGNTRWILLCLFFSAPTNLQSLHDFAPKSPILTGMYRLGFFSSWFVSSYCTTCSFSRQSDDQFIRRQIYVSPMNPIVGWCILERSIERLICLSQR